MTSKRQLKTKPLIPIVEGHIIYSRQEVTMMMTIPSISANTSTRTLPPQQGADAASKIRSLEQKIQRLNTEKQKAMQRKDKEQKEMLEKQIEKLEKQIQQMKQQENRQSNETASSTPPADPSSAVGTYLDVYA